MRPATLHQDTLDRQRQVLGEDHPHTLLSTHNLAADLRALGEARAARDLAQDVLDRLRRILILGEDHPGTLDFAGYLAMILRDLGEAETARDLDQDTLHRRRRPGPGPPRHPGLCGQPGRRPARPGRGGQ
jgi:hypothetical protein